MKNKCIRRAFYLLIIVAFLGLCFFLITYNNKSTKRIFMDTTSKALSTKTKIDVKSEIEKYNLMPEYVRKAKKKNKNERIEDNIKPNLLNRNFNTDAPNKVVL